MLGSDKLSVRLGGIFALERLAGEHPEEYHVLVMKLLCAFLRHSTEDTTEEPNLENADPSSDFQAALDAIGGRTEHETELETSANYRLDLRRVLLRRASLHSANLSHVRLSWACLVQAALGKANLSHAILNQADLTGATLGGANLSEASLHRAKLQSAVFWDLPGPGPLQFITYSNALSQGDVLTANLSKARLDHADMSGVSLQGADLSGALLTDAVLSRADLSGADLSDATLLRADLSGAVLSDKGTIPATGIRQGQLDHARSDPNSPPNLHGVLDAVTGKQLVWKGNV